MNSRKNTLLALLPVLVLSGVLLSPCATWGQASGSWWSTASWFDWSDFRAYAGARLWLANLYSGTLTVDGTSYDLKTDLGMGQDPEPFGQVWAMMYLDRLGFRYHLEDNHRFFGRTNLPTPVTLTDRVHELDIRTPRLGLDLDLIRYNFAKLGINYDYDSKPVRVHLREDPSGVNTIDPSVYLQADPPMTIGFHGHVIPMRLRGVPIILQTRFRFPIPFIDEHFRPTAARIVDWEICGGLRPAVWDTSHFGFSTFSVSLEVGYQLRTITFNLDNPNADLKARWQGAFFRCGLFY